MFAAPEAFPPASAQWSTHIPDFSRPDYWLSHNLHFDHPVHLLSKPAWVQSYRAHPNILIFYSIADRSPGDAPDTFDLIFRSTRFSVFLSVRSEEYTSELQSRGHLVCRLLLEKK